LDFGPWTLDSSVCNWQTSDEDVERVVKAVAPSEIDLCLSVNFKRFPTGKSLSNRLKDDSLLGRFNTASPGFDGLDFEFGRINELRLDSYVHSAKQI
jgi:hypothetical protein